MNHALRLAHYIAMHRADTWDHGEMRKLSRAALAEHDRLRMRVTELERHNKRLKDPRDRVMTELA